MLYAVDDAHGAPAAWLAHRNAVVAATFALLTLACHLRWRCDGWRPGAVLAPLALGAGLLVGEAALGAAAYLFAFALLLDPLTRQPWAPRRRLLTLWAYAGCVVLWRLVHQRLGCGAFGSGVYLDPVREPLTFAAAAAQRTPLLLAGQLGRPPPDLATFLPATTAPMLALALLLLLGVALALRPLWRHLARRLRGGRCERPLLPPLRSGATPQNAESSKLPSATKL